MTAPHAPLSAHLGPYTAHVETAIDEIAADEVIDRIWDHDHTVWQDDPTEITNRLGWLHSAEAMVEHIGRITALVEDVRADGYSDVLLMGMGGSSLAPELFGRTFGPVEDGRSLEVLDSTDPAAVRAAQARVDPADTLFVVATKSGTTVETRSFLKHFYRWTVDSLGQEAAGAHFVAITDPGSALVELAEAHGFRDVFLNDPEIGGRYSALSYFGLVPAALVGVDLHELLDRARGTAERCRLSAPAGENPAARLGAILGALGQAGRDKVTFVVSEPVAGFADWAEQLIAESTGKSGTGIVPVAGEPLGPPAAYGEDRLFVHLRLAGDSSDDEALAALADAGHPVVRVDLRDRYDLGGQFFLWMMAVAVAGARLGIHPFSQPNVEAAKQRAREMVEAYTETGQLPEGEVAPLERVALERFLARAERGDYLALQAYVQRTPAVHRELQALRVTLRDRLQLATTLGYGPRYLHSTGQLHKGDDGSGLFVMLTAEPRDDLPVPETLDSDTSSITFGVLKRAQAQGDYRALEDAGRRVIRFDLGTDVLAGLAALRAAPSKKERA